MSVLEEPKKIVKEIETKMPENLTAYMTKLRKKDPELYTPKYTRQCPEVNKRQPIILTKLELENMKIKNIDGYNKIKDNILEWGSTDKKLHNYICPRIWCLNCKIVLTEKQLIDNKGKCVVCKKGIIKTNKIGKQNSIIIRRAKSNEYWSKDILPEDFHDQSGKLDKDVAEGKITEDEKKKKIRR